MSVNTAYVQIKALYAGVSVPTYAHVGDAGFDIALLEDVEIPPMKTVRVPTGLAFGIPDGFELQLRLRSNIAYHTPIIMPNAPATIDSGYRGEVKVLLTNLSTEPWHLNKGNRVVQAILSPVYTAVFVPVDELDATERGSGGFGSTGK